MNATRKSTSSADISGLKKSFQSLSSRSLLLFGGKGGVGKTTVSALAAIHFSKQRPVVLFTSDPASNLGDLFGDEIPRDIELEQLDAEQLYEAFLSRNIDSFLELGDRGTYLDKGELRRLLELSIPGIDELMAWMHIGDLALNQSERMVIVDTAPTGHTLRMLSSSQHFLQFAKALNAMQGKHREIIEQLTRRRVRDSIDDFVERFQADAQERVAFLQDPARTAFIPVSLAQPWVIEQTKRIVYELKQQHIDVPFVALNQTPHEPDCQACREKHAANLRARQSLQPLEVVEVRESCSPLDSVLSLRRFLVQETSTGVAQTLLSVRRGAPSRRVGGETAASGRAQAGVPVPHLLSDSLPQPSPPSSPHSQPHSPGGNESNLLNPVPLDIPRVTKMLFFAGKGGVGKTTSASSVALQFAISNPGRPFTLISVDPAHTVSDVFSQQAAPANLRVETIDTREQWELLRSSIGEEIDRVISGLTPKGLSLRHDSDVMHRLLDIAPPGADELFAVMRLHELLENDDSEMVIVDTAPTGHFLRLIDLPGTAGEWVREFMRILLNYRELVPPGSLGEQLVRASRALHSFHDGLRSERSAVIIVTRPDRIVALETTRLQRELRERGIHVAGFIANYVTPVSTCTCDSTRRRHEAATLVGFAPLTIVERQRSAVTALSDLQKLIPISQTGR